MTSGNHWQSPDPILNRVRRVDVVALDPCTVAANPTGADAIITAEDDPCGLFADWAAVANGGLVYCNPPFGRGVAAEFAAKIVVEAAYGCEVIALTRGDMSTAWSRRMALAATLICFPPRIRFRDATGSPPFANTLFYYGPRPQTFRRAFETLGPLVTPITRRQE